jgi:hypothetical protein
VQAEQMLARACENEAENAKRMRMGMEPVSQPLPVPMSYSAPMDIITGMPGSGVGSPLTLTVTMDKTKMEYKPEHLATLLSTGSAGGNPGGGGIPVSVNGTPATVQYRQVKNKLSNCIFVFPEVKALHHSTFHCHLMRYFFIHVDRSQR